MTQVSGSGAKSINDTPNPKPAVRISIVSTESGAFVLAHINGKPVSMLDDKASAL